MRKRVDERFDDFCERLERIEEIRTSDEIRIRAVEREVAEIRIELRHAREQQATPAHPVPALRRHHDSGDLERRGRWKEHSPLAGALAALLIAAAALINSMVTSSPSPPHPPPRQELHQP